MVFLRCSKQETQVIPDTPIAVSGIYPHLAMYNERPNDRGVGESGIGVVVPWAGKLWTLTYAASHPFGGADKLYEIDSNLNRVIRPESTGGTHANRMIHMESEQLIMGPYFINKDRKVRSVPSSEMSGRLTGVVRHLTDPANKVYFYAMEEGFYEVDVNTLDVKELYPDGYIKDPSKPNAFQVLDREHISGTHGKGAYTSQGRVIVSNNGIRHWADANPAGVTGGLGSWDGTKWTDVDTRQFLEVTGPGGIYGNANETDPVWATGWDYRSAILKVRDQGTWYDYRFPKASFTYDGLHGHFTEWPRIREINDGRYLMTMHGMFWEFPKTFSVAHSAGIKPLSSYLKIVVDYAAWNGNVVMGCDDASTFENQFVGRPQSNLWFVRPDKLDSFGPRNGFGGVWVDEHVKKDEQSSPFLTAGFDRIVLHLAHQSGKPVTFTIEMDQKGDNTWTEYQQITIPARGYVYHIFPKDFSATWVRLRSNENSNNTVAYFVLSQDDRRKAEEQPALFYSIPLVGDKSPRTYGLIRPGASDDVGLQYVAYAETDGVVTPLGYYEVDGKMNMTAVENDTIAQWLTKKVGIDGPDYAVDNASVVVRDGKGAVFRLPKGSDGYADDEVFRGIREVVTERSLFNCSGTFYELPRNTSAGIAGIKPITTHNRLIYDFCSWRGMMVIAGNLSGARENGNFFASDDGKTGLWFGTIDDLWKFGKPIGKGGPWLNTKVNANEPSDPYLMTGYDKKKMTLSHNARTPVTFTVEVDLTAYGDWTTFAHFTIPPGQTFTYDFPEGYAAHWIRLNTDVDCTASAQFEYY